MTNVFSICVRKFFDIQSYYIFVEYAFLTASKIPYFDII